MIPIQTHQVTTYEIWESDSFDNHEYIVGFYGKGAERARDSELDKLQLAYPHRQFHKRLGKRTHYNGQPEYSLDDPRSIY